MRDIKFRAWYDKDGSGEMVFFGLIDNRDQVEYLDGCPAMQSTGVVDKNGKEVYEGDVIQWTVIHKSDFRNEITESHSLLEVRWGKTGWVLWSELFKKFGYPNGDTCNEMHTYGYLRKSIVVGNIYEHPELLEIGK